MTPQLPNHDPEFTLDLKKIRNHPTFRYYERLSRESMKKVTASLMLVASISFSVGPTVTLFAASETLIPNSTASETDSGGDPLKSSNSSGSLSRQQGADLLSLQTYQTSPFVTSGGSSQAGYIEHKQSFEELARDLSISKNYTLFQKAALDVLNASGLCSSGSSSSSSSSSSNASSGNTSTASSTGNGATSQNTPNTNQTAAAQETGTPSSSQRVSNDTVRTNYTEPDGSTNRVDTITAADGSKSYVYCQGCGSSGCNSCSNTNTNPTSTGSASVKKSTFLASLSSRFNALMNTTPAFAGTIEDRLKDCANNKPDEFATVSNMIRTYFEWQNTELHTVSQYYTNKLTSPILRDRIEGRLVAACLREQLADNDSAAAYNYCRKPANWKVEKTFYASCSNSASGTQNGNAFDYKQYTKDCVVSNVVKDSLGAQLYLDMIPNFKISVDSSGVTFRSEPYTETPASMFHLIYEQTYAYLTSSWFQNFATQGCIPSVYAPKDFADKVQAKDGTAANYYSVCLPQQLMESINALPAIDQKFFNSVIAKRIAMIQVIELLNGGVLIAEETHRNLMAADREVGTLVDSFPRYMSAVQKLYKDQIDLVHSKKLDDVLEKISDLMSKYQDENSKTHQGLQDSSEELIRLKNRRSNGE